MTPLQLASANLQDDGHGNMVSLLGHFKTSCQWFAMVHFYNGDMPYQTCLDPTSDGFSWEACHNAVNFN